MDQFHIPSMLLTSLNAVRICFAATYLSIMLTGRARTTRIDIPVDFHGHISIVCADNTAQTMQMSVNASGKAFDVSCPAHETMVIVMRGNKPERKTPRITWSSTGLVRTINFDVRKRFLNLEPASLDE